ncbi:unnamed protein product, partial [marine sediment metagenome]
RSHAPRYYSTTLTRCYTTSLPRQYIYYEDCRAHDEPVVYIGRSTPRVVVYDGCYPRAYRTTYTRSDCYTRPLRHSRATVRHYRSGHRVHHYRQRVTSRHHYSRSRPGLALYRHHSGSRYHHGTSYDRCRRWRDRHRGSSIRVRIGRR